MQEKKIIIAESFKIKKKIGRPKLVKPENSFKIIKKDIVIYFD